MTATAMNHVITHQEIGLDERKPVRSALRDEPTKDIRAGPVTCSGETTS